VIFISKGHDSSIDGQIKVVVNGKEMELKEGMVIQGLLEILDIKTNGVAVELNLEIVPKGRYVQTVLKEGDRIEIIRMAGGG
jgi:sulfur carrier protein